MAEIISFFADFEYTIYFILAMGFLVVSWRFYSAWRELRGSVFGLEQINAQRRLNNAAIGMFLLVLMGFIVFSLVTFVQPGLGVAGNEPVAESQLAAAVSAEGFQTESMPAEPTSDQPATATPLPTVEVNPNACRSGEEDVNKINILSPRWNEEVRGLVDVVGIVDVEDFGFYKLEIAPADTGLWFGISVGETMAPEESVLVTFDSSFYPPGNYVLQLLVTNHDVQEYEPCRIPIRIAPTD